MKAAVSAVLSSGSEVTRNKHVRSFMHTCVKSWPEGGVESSMKSRLMCPLLRVTSRHGLKEAKISWLEMVCFDVVLPSGRQSPCSHMVADGEASQRKRLVALKCPPRAYYPA